MNTDIVRDGPVDPKEMDDLRQAVGWDRSDGDLDKVLARAFAHYTVRDEHGRLVAYMSVLSDGVADAFLLDLAVHPQCRHKGVGTQIVRRAIADMKAVGVQCVHVTFAPDLEPFYAQCGLCIIKAGIVDFKTMKWNATANQASQPIAGKPGSGCAPVGKIYEDGDSQSEAG